MTDEQKWLVQEALFAADRLTEFAGKLLAALNRKAEAIERCEGSDTRDIAGPGRAVFELEQAEDEVSEYWCAIQSATYEYQKRAKLVRAAGV